MIKLDLIGSVIIMVVLFWFSVEVELTGKHEGEEPTEKWDFYVDDQAAKRMTRHIDLSLLGITKCVQKKL